MPVFVKCQGAKLWEAGWYNIGGDNTRKVLNKGRRGAGLGCPQIQLSLLFRGGAGQEDGRRVFLISQLELCCQLRKRHARGSLVGIPARRHPCMVGEPESV